MPFVIGTAGHIDHGKTSLVKALTGQDTDRLKEEKERGISIDLGFAYMDLPDGTRAGVVDVPGHERFIRNMLAGAHGLDLVLFTVAADDGVMPQTEEHFEIVHLLGVTRAIFVITKADLVSESRLREVEEEVAALTARTALGGAPTLAVSSVTLDGLDALRAAIAAELRAASSRQATGYFRLPVDRVFSLRGHGLVVTGTVLDGEVRVGDHVRSLPGEELLRVRSLHVHDVATEVARAGQRAALNLIGHETPTVTRGHVICADALASTTVRIDAWLDVRPSARTAVESHDRVRVHIGAAERLATCIVLDADRRIEPGSTGFVQFVLRAPVHALRSDRFIVRDETAQRTLGGGVVLQAQAAKHRKPDTPLLDELRTLHLGSLAEVVVVLLTQDASFATSLGRLRELANASEADVRTALATASVRSFDAEGDVVYTTNTKWQDVRSRVLSAVGAFHATHPLATGMEMESVREGLPADVTPRLFRAIVDQLTVDTVLVRDASLVRLPTHTVRLDDGEQRIVDRVLALLGASPLSPPDLKQLEVDAGVPRAKLIEVLRLLEREQRVVRVAPDLVFQASAIAALKAQLRQRVAVGGEVTPARFKELFGTSRKYTIPLLEYLDREGVTFRRGESRRLRA